MTIEHKNLNCFIVVNKPLASSQIMLSILFFHREYFLFKNVKVLGNRCDFPSECRSMVSL